MGRLHDIGRPKPLGCDWASLSSPLLNVALGSVVTASQSQTGLLRRVETMKRPVGAAVLWPPEFPVLSILIEQDITDGLPWAQTNFCTRP